MEAKRKRRRFLFPTLATMAGLAASGWAAVEFDVLRGRSLPAVEVSSGTGALDAIEQAWVEQQLTAPQAAARPAAPRATPPATPPVVDPVATTLENTDALAAIGSRYVDSEPLAIEPRTADPLVARGQQPRGGALDIEASGELPTGNPLRGRYDTPPSANQQAFAEQFTSGPETVDNDNALYTAPPASSSATRQGIRVDLGPEARVQPAVAETPVADGALNGSELPAAIGPPSTVEEPAEIASPPELPLVDLPIETRPAAPVSPTASLPVTELPVTELPVAELPVNEPPVSQFVEQPIARVAGRDASVPGTFNPPAGVGAIEPVTDAGFGSTSDTLASTTPAAPRPGDPSLEGRQQPSIAVQKFAPDQVQIGKPCKFLVKIRNDSPRAIGDVVVKDHTPAGARLVSTSPTAEMLGDAIRWQIGTLGPGEQRTLEMEIVPTEEGELGSVATVSFSAQASAKALCTRPLLALRLTAPPQVLVGEQQRLQIELKNPGTGDATNVMLVENVPQNLRHEGGSTLEFEVGTLRAGESRQLELVMDAEAPGAVNNLLVARADGGLEVQQSIDFEVIAPSLAVALKGPTRRFLNRPATYTVRIDNPGTAAARDIRLVARLPRGMQFVKANNLGEYDASSHSVYWALAELPEGEGGEVQLTALPTTPGEMTIEAEGRTGTGLEDKVSHQVRIEGIAAVDFEVLDVEDPIEVGGQTQYEVRVSNSGTKAATGVQVRVIAPAGMRVLSASGPTRHAIDSSGVVFEPLGRLAPRGENTYRLRVEAAEAGDQRVMVEVKTDDLVQPVRKEEATRVFGNE